MNALQGNSQEKKPLVLIVEPDEANRNLVSRLLQHACEVVSCESGTTGFEKALELYPDLVISTSHCVLSDGMTLTRKIKDTPRLQMTPLILLSEETNLDARIHGYAEGADDFIFKPFEISEFITRVKSLIKSRTELRILAENYRAVAERNDHFEIQLEMSVSLQTKLLADNVPTVPGFDISAVYLPKDKVGGDFYEFNMLEENQLGIFIADAAGHGIPAAFLASISKLALQFSRMNTNSCKDVIELLDKIIHEKSIQELFVTCFYAILDLETHELRYASAGHQPAIIHNRESGKVTYLRQESIPLGLLYADAERSKFQYTEDVVQLKEADRLLFYTDGLLDSYNEDRQEFGIRGLRNSLKKHKDLPTEEFALAIIQDLREHTGTMPFSDDLTLIAVDRKA